MAAMLIDITYDPFYFILSIVIALVASIAALWLSFYFRRGGKGAAWKKLGSGLIMGAAIVGMHYTGMTAAHFHLGDKSLSSAGMILDQNWLGYFISGGTLFTLGLSLLGIYISNKFSYKDSEIQEKAAEIYQINQELRQLNENLENLVKERTEQLEQAHDEAIKASMIKSRFEPHEVERMKLHTSIGSSILEGSSFKLLKVARLIAESHHEKWDGSGYPLGLKGEEIPHEARIVALADFYDALTHERPYKRAWTREETLAEIKAQRGKHFDPQLVDVFIQLIEEQ